ncbi:hypothetical protein Dimus_013952 [Dionaea muscipula]
MANAHLVFSYCRKLVMTTTSRVKVSARPIVEWPHHLLELAAHTMSYLRMRWPDQSFKEVPVSRMVVAAKLGNTPTAHEEGYWPCTSLSARGGYSSRDMQLVVGVVVHDTDAACTASTCSDTWRFVCSSSCQLHCPHASACSLRMVAAEVGRSLRMVVARWRCNSPKLLARLELRLESSLIALAHAR